ncbi:hypothetical protein [Pantoea agglomerans]|uniref:Uncharacterized protein n=1 Tax=Enterobacter agglomerans TaxID=549 RepID=A0ACC5PJ04_ENTAG|nr:hypothetical protein [Pantoea agglomerans]MBD8241005.1 hypothetical protein [Pantoea agglomerans]
MTDAARAAVTLTGCCRALRYTKGLGNFHNIFMYVSNGKPHGTKILPLSEVTTKDDFFKIRKDSRDDLLSAHRVPPPDDENYPG